MNWDLFTLKVFETVLTTGSFTSAAKELRVTQPTVSQQIAKLESSLGVKLFQRVGHRIVPTPDAERLSALSRSLLDQVNAFESEFKHTREALKGKVRYAMPESCQWTPHYRKIMASLKEIPEICFKISILSNSDTLSLLLQGKIDFGFVVGERLSPEIRFEKFSDEPVLLVAKTQDLLRPFQNREFLSQARWIDYPGSELFFSTWCKFHGVYQELKRNLPHPSVKIDTLAGAVHALEEGAGAAFLPGQCVANALEAGTLKEWSPKKQVASHPVYLAQRRGEIPPRRVQHILDSFKKLKAS